jgi:phage terminase small subunit
MPNLLSAPAVASSNACDCPLEGPALELWQKVHEQWDLDPLSERILRSACESLLVSNRAQALIDAEGLVVIDRAGRPTKHPAVIISRDARQHYTLALARLKLDLE